MSYNAILCYDHMKTKIDPIEVMVSGLNRDEIEEEDYESISLTREDLHRLLSKGYQIE